PLVVLERLGDPVTDVDFPAGDGRAAVPGRDRLLPQDLRPVLRERVEEAGVLPPAVAGRPQPLGPIGRVPMSCGYAPGDEPGEPDGTRQHRSGPPGGRRFHPAAGPPAGRGVARILPGPAGRGTADSPGPTATTGPPRPVVPAGVPPPTG